MELRKAGALNALYSGAGTSGVATGAYKYRGSKIRDDMKLGTDLLTRPKVF